MHSLNIFQHNVFQTDTIFTKAVSPIHISALTQELPAQCKSPGLYCRLISPHKSNKQHPAVFPTSLCQQGWDKLLWGPLTDPFCPV